MRRPETTPVTVAGAGQAGEAAASSGASSFAVDAGRFLLSALTCAFPLFLVVVAVLPWHPLHAYAWDFRAFYGAGAAYLHLHNPYLAASLANLTSQQNFVYPLPIAALFAPVSLLPYGVAAVLFIAASALLLGAGLRMLGLRDWRCYAAVYLSLPVQYGLKLGTISPLLVFLLALLWRHRDRAWVAAPALALLVVSKLFLWPVALWFLFTRRYRVFGLAVLCSVVGWALAAIPFGVGVLTHYPHLLRAVSSFESPQSLSLYALAVALGASTAGAFAVSVAVGGLVLYSSFRWSRTDQSRAFRAIVLAALLLSPIVWDHYLVLLAVPLALARPRFSPLWLVLSWVMFDGFVLGHTAFVLTTLSVLVLSTLQAGILPRIRGNFVGSLPRKLLGLVVPAALVWVLFLVAFIDSVGILALSAALRPARQSPSGSGSAFVRLSKTGNTICWRVWTSTYQPGSAVELVKATSQKVLARHALPASPGHESCVPLRHSFGRVLVTHYEAISGGYDLVVRSPTGRLLLAGVVVRRVDAGSPVAQTETLRG